MVGIHDDKGMISHMNTLLLHRSDKIVMPIRFPPQQGRQQPYKTWSGNFAALMPPASVSGNRQIHLTYLRRLPGLHRRNLAIGLNMLEQRIEVHRGLLGYTKPALTSASRAALEGSGAAPRNSR